MATAHRHAPYAARKTGDSKIASQGVASFYSDEQETASGEKFNAHELTAAHPTLPFGTKLRVTDVKTGRSVTVRVNDRGPYVPGRIVDVSYSAAQSLGMIGKGVANVRLDVVQWAAPHGRGSGFFAGRIGKKSRCHTRFNPVVWTTQPNRIVAATS
ncbi:septal ring lytic transglycosylase RlpA family protein, partial [Mycoplasmoides pneumoniae]